MTRGEQLQRTLRQCEREITCQLWKFSVVNGRLFFHPPMGEVSWPIEKLREILAWAEEMVKEVPGETRTE